MAGTSAKDSWSPCEEPSMLYHAVRYPSAISAPSIVKQKSVEPSKAIVESAQKRLNREMSEKFQNTDPKLSYHSYVAVAQAGKYLFLVIMLPLYVCCYAIPKWLFYILLPRIFAIFCSYFLRVGRFFGQRVSRGAYLIKKMLGNILRNTKRQPKAFKDAFKRWGSRQVGRLVQFKEKVAALRRSVHEVVLCFIKTGCYSILKAVKGTAKPVFQAVVKAFKALARAILYPLDLADRVLFTPFLRWFRRRLTPVVAWIKRVSSKFFKLIERITSLLKIVFAPFYRFIVWSYRSLKIIVKRVIVFFQPKIVVASQSVAAKIRLVLIPTKKFFKKIYRFSRHPASSTFYVLKKALKKASILLVSLFSRLNRLFQRAYGLLSGFISKKASDKASKPKSQPPVRTRLLLKANTAFAPRAGLFLRLSKNLWLRGWQTLWRGLHAPLGLLTVVFGQTFRGLARVFLKCVGGIGKSAYVMRWMLAWSIAFGRLGMEIVRKYADEIDGWLFVSHKKTL